MSPSRRYELTSPTFILALLAFLVSIAGGVYTLGFQANRIDTATETNAAQDLKLEKMGEKVDAGFNRMADKIDALRVELKAR